MGKLENNQKGFSAIEIVLVVVILALIGVVGWLVYKNRHQSTNTVNSAKTSTNTPAVSSNAPAKTSTPTSMPTHATTTPTFTSGPQSGWETYTNAAVGFSISYPNFIRADSACATPSTLSSGTVPSTFIQNGVNFYIAAKNSFRLTLTWSANNTFAFSGCTEVPTTVATIQAYNASVSKNAQYSYSAVNLPFVVEKVASTNDIQTELQSYWKDNTITVSGWKNSTSGNYEVPTVINCSQTEENNQSCGPQNSNYDLRYYPTQNLMFYFIYGQSAHLILPNGSVADSQIIKSFTVL